MELGCRFGSRSLVFDWSGRGLLRPCCREQQGEWILIRLDGQGVEGHLDLLFKRFDFQTSWEAHPGHLPVMSMPVFDARQCPVVDETILNAFPADPIQDFRGQNVINVLRYIGLISDRLADTLLSGGYDPSWLDIGTAREPPVLQWVAISGNRLPEGFEGKTFRDFHHLYYADLRPDPNIAKLPFEASQGLQRIPQRPTLAASAVPAVHPGSLRDLARQNGDVVQRHVTFAREKHISSWAPSAMTSTLG